MPTIFIDNHLIIFILTFSSMNEVMIIWNFFFLLKILKKQ